MPIDANAVAKLHGPGHPVRTITCRVSAIEQATHDIRVLYLEPDDSGPFVYSAGQYVRAAFEGQEERDYSLASRPNDPFLALHIRNARSGPSLYASTRVGVGDKVTLRGPFGDTYLRPEHPGPIVAVAGGSGLAPIKAIVEEALELGLKQPIHLYFGVRDERDIYMEAYFTGLCRRHPNLRFTPVLSEASGKTKRRRGLVTDAIASDLRDLSGAVAYLAGPPPMVEAAGTLLRGLGVAAEDIHADAFIGEAERRRLEGEK
jgi:CDP-4-dehydro-6-deoxyglucose reductase/ferredoxin-NAD(P)+ reductase (naphthalene dioxygenase ferredoxin-specific)